MLPLPFKQEELNPNMEQCKSNLFYIISFSNLEAKNGSNPKLQTFRETF